jgi:CHRD domain
MSKRLLLAGVLAVMVIVPALATASSAKTVSAKLTGKAETPAGDSNGSGFVVIKLNEDTGRVCWTFSKVKDIGTPQVAHIHKGKAGKSGPVWIPLGGAYKAKGCVTATKHQVDEVLEYPNRYYVNIHNAKYPNGAIRGQLAFGLKG